MFVLLMVYFIFDLRYLYESYIVNYNVLMLLPIIFNNIIIFRRIMMMIMTTKCRFVNHKVELLKELEYSTWSSCRSVSVIIGVTRINVVAINAATSTVHAGLLVTAEDVCCCCCCCYSS